MVEIVKFETPNCGPCKWVQITLDRIIDEVEKQINKKLITFTVVDASIEQERSLLLNITKTPTVVVFKDGKEIHRFVDALFNQDDYLAVIFPLLQ